MSAKRADVIGTNRANAIIVIACRTTIKGEKGRDGIHVELRDGGTWTTPQRGKYRGTIYGGPDNDAINGSTGNDRLIGGPGRDIVRGRDGRDVCQGERVRDCEKRI